MQRICWMCIRTRILGRGELLCAMSALGAKAAIGIAAAIYSVLSGPFLGSDNVTSSIVSPSRILYSRLNVGMIFSSWVTTIIAVLNCNSMSLRSPMTARARSPSSGAVGSSASIAGGRLTSARAIATRCCSAAPAIRHVSLSARSCIRPDLQEMRCFLAHPFRPQRGS